MIKHISPEHRNNLINMPLKTALYLSMLFNIDTGSSWVYEEFDINHYILSYWIQLTICIQHRTVAAHPTKEL